MRPAETTPEEIIQAGQQLQAAGREVTGSALRRALGDKGNTVRLKQIWQEHLASQAAAVVEPAAALPVEVAQKVEEVTRFLVDRLSALAGEMNSTATRVAEGRAAEIRRVANELRDAAERELEDAAQTLDDLEGQLEAAKAESKGMGVRLSEMHAANQAQAVELAQLRERLALTEQAAEKAAREQADELVRQRAILEDERARHLAELGEAKKAAEQVGAERDAARAELAAVKAKADAAVQTYQEQRKQAASEANRGAERLTKAQAERDEARKEAAAAREEAAQLRGQTEAMQAQVAELMRALAQRGANV